MQSPSNVPIIAESAQFASASQVNGSERLGNALTPGQALEQHAHFKRRLERRARSYAAARQRLSLAREEFKRIDQLAAEARVYFPVGSSA